MKKTATIAFLIFVVLTAIVYVAALAFRQGQQSATNAVSNSNPAPSPAASSASAANTASTKNPVYTYSQVAQHSSPQDCWTVINGKVYNVTALVDTHSGGAGTILNSCGQDSSVSFNTKDGQGRHSGRAQAALNNYFVGTLTQSAQ